MSLRIHLYYTIFQRRSQLLQEVLEFLWEILETCIVATLLSQPPHRGYTDDLHTDDPYTDDLYTDCPYTEHQMTCIGKPFVKGMTDRVTL